jgi:hypothetical protein
MPVDAAGVLYHCGWVLCFGPQSISAIGVQAEQQAATAAQLGGGALVEQCHQLQADLMICQQVGGLAGPNRHSSSGAVWCGVFLCRRQHG